MYYAEGDLLSRAGSVLGEFAIKPGALRLLRLGHVLTSLEADAVGAQVDVNDRSRNGVRSCGRSSRRAELTHEASPAAGASCRAASINEIEGAREYCQHALPPLSVRVRTNGMVQSVPAPRVRTQTGLCCDATNCDPIRSDDSAERRSAATPNCSTMVPGRRYVPQWNQSLS
jgi:hypothetical protein